MNYGKFRFEQSKKEKEARKNQHVVEIKEIRMSPGIDVGDFNTKLKNAQKFIADGNRVKVSVRFRGREMAHTDIGRDLLNQFAEQCAEVANMDKSAKLEGRMMSIFLSPKTEQVNFKRYSIHGRSNYNAETENSQRRQEALQSHQDRQGQARQGFQEPHPQRHSKDHQAALVALRAGGYADETNDGRRPASMIPYK